MKRLFTWLLVPGLLAAQEPEQTPVQDSLFLRAWAEPSQCTRQRCALRLVGAEGDLWVVRGEPGNRMGRAAWHATDFFELGNTYVSDIRGLEVAVASSLKAAEMVRAAASAARARAGSENLFGVSFLSALLVERLGQGRQADAIAVGVGSVGMTSLVAATTWQFALRRRVDEAIRIYNESLPETASGESP